jgi:hypothetical protein
MKCPLDSFPYPPDPRRRLAAGGLPDGVYVYVQDESGDVWVLPDGPHLHPKVLGDGRAAQYAGDLTIEKGVVVDVTNLSGTFQFADEYGLLHVAERLKASGLVVPAGAVRFFPADGGRPIVLAWEG